MKSDSISRKRFRFFITLFLTACLCLSGCRKENGNVEKSGITIRTELPSEQIFRQAVETSGVIVPLEHAVLSSRISGTLEELHVKEGASVKKGEALFRQDRQTLENRRTLAEETVKMAMERVKTRKIESELAKLKFAKAEADFQRDVKLYQQRIISENTYESSELNWKTASLTRDKAVASLLTAEAEVNIARAALNIAEKNLEDSIIRAPYDGVITAKLKEEHEFCGAGTPILKIEQPGRKKLETVLSGLHFGSIRKGETKVQIAFGGKTVAVVPVTYVGDTIDPVSRTFEVKAELPENSGIASGALAEASFILAERKSLSVPEEAVLSRKDGKHAVFADAGGKAEEIAVIPGVTHDGRTEILNADAVREKRIIVSGQYFVNPGTPVRTASEAESK